MSTANIQTAANRPRSGAGALLMGAAIRCGAVGLEAALDLC